MLYFNGKQQEVLDTKIMYNMLVNKKKKLYLHEYWTRNLQCEVIWKDIFTFIKNIPDNRYKEFKYRMLKSIFTRRQILNPWKIGSKSTLFYMLKISLIYL